MFMVDRIASLETHAEHFQKDLSRIEGKIDKLDEKIDGHQKSFVAFQLETVEARMIDRIGWLLIAAGLLGVMARGFKWI
jgi:hypothetical protein